MNQQLIQEKRNNIRRLVRSATIKPNVVYFNTHNSWTHERIKAKICYHLQSLGKHYITEAPFGVEETGIADILNLDDAQIIEILYSETLKQCEWKARKFPDCIEVVAVKKARDYIEGNYKVIKMELI